MQMETLLWIKARQIQSKATGSCRLAVMQGKPEQGSGTNKEEVRSTTKGALQ